MCFTNRFLGTREICYSDCLLTLGLINGNQAFWRIPSSLAFPFPCSLGRNRGFESSNTTASSFQLVVNILLFLYPPCCLKEFISNMNSFVQGGSLQIVFKQDSLEMQQDVTPGSAPAFPIHSVCRPGVSLLEISAQTQSLRQLLFHHPFIQGQFPSPCSLHFHFSFLHPSNFLPNLISLLWSF